MNILEDLWFGNISPWERLFKKDSPYAELLAIVVRHQEDLLRRLNDEEKEIFEKFADCTTEICEFHCFADGNKRLAITINAQFLLFNGYMAIAQ